MKKLLLVACLLSISISTFGQNDVTEAYFHELKGIEDSAGVTHLFYRQYIKGQFECSGDNPKGSPSVRENDVYHYNFYTKTDSVLFAEYFSEWCLTGVIDNKSITSYTFYENNPEKWIISGAYQYTLSISDYTGRSLDYNVASIAIKINSKSSTPSYIPVKVMLSPNEDSLYVKTFLDNIIPFPGNSEEWLVFEDNEEFIEYADSLLIEWNIINIHPDIDSLYFAVNSSGNLYRSNHYSSDFTFSDSSKYFRNLFFDADTSHIYALNSSGILRSDDLGMQGSWEFTEINFNTGSPKYLTIDEIAAGQIFVSDSTHILFSDNYGDNFIGLLSVDNEITGLYKKPNSNILYVLTREELLEVNTETKSTTFLKQLLVSNEWLPDVPTQVELEQNYPNPFNPATNIVFRVKNSGHVTLIVYDQLGRKVQTLVDGFREAGAYMVYLDARGLASGIYYYRLETEGEVMTKKMTFVK